MRSILHNIYGEPAGEAAFSRIKTVLDAFLKKNEFGRREAAFSASDAVLISYGDTLLREGEQPLQTLQRLSKYCPEAEHVCGNKYDTPEVGVDKSVEFLINKHYYSRMHHEDCLSPLPFQNRRGDNCFEAADLSPPGSM